MKNVNKILAFITFFAIVLMFTGAVSAANWNVSAGNSIQNVIDNASVNDTVTINDNNGTAYTYNENLVINKKVNIVSGVGANPIIMGAVTINSGGSGSTLQNLTVKGIINLYANDCLIYNNTIIGIGGNSGITTSNSFNNIITCNSITNYCYTNFCCGIISYSSSNTIYGNTIHDIQDRDCAFGIYSEGSNNNITGNNLINNDIGIFTFYSADTLQFNRITGNIIGLMNEGGTVNATNNWWGSNTPTVGSGEYDIVCYSGTIFYDPWLILNATSSPTNTNNNSTITADLTHNSAGNDTSPQGHIPDNILVNFTTNLGTITNNSYTRNGKVNTTFNRGTTTSGTANITATIDNQNTQTNVTIDIIAPTVNASLANGTYNTTQTVTLTTTDNLDQNPTVFYSLNNGTTWNNQTRTVTLNLNSGETVLMFYARDAAGNIGTIQTRNYTIDIPPTVTANLLGGVYNTTQIVTLNATDDLDPNPTIYYTINGTTPTTSSTKYTSPITISTKTTLKFMAVDKTGNQATVQTKNFYFKIQDAINDTPSFGTVLINTGAYMENVVVDKTLTIMPVQGANVIWKDINYSSTSITINPGANLTIYNITFTNSTPLRFDNGNGIYNTGLPIHNYGNLNILNCTFLDNFQAIENDGGEITVINSTFADNYGGIGNYGGNCKVVYNMFINNTNTAIANGGTLNVSDSSFIGNKAEYGGAIVNIFGDIIPGFVNCIITNSNFINNTATYDGGAIYNPFSAMNVTSCTFIGNNATYGSVIFNDASLAFINFNRIVGNGNYGIYNENNGTVNANNNWWGSNNGPTVSDIYNVNDNSNLNGTVSCSSWLVLTLTSPGVIITQNNSFNMPVSLATNNILTDASSQGHAPNGIPINFTTTMGAINSTVFTNNGIAMATINYNTTMGNITASLDNQTVSIVQRVFNTIQAAIDDPNTLNGSYLLLAAGNYTENIVLDKNIILGNANGGNVTIQALNSSLPVIKINPSANGTLITGLTIKGATNSSGVFLNGTSNCNIVWNNLVCNYNGIYLLNSNNNTIKNNVLTDNSQMGVCFEYSNNNVAQYNDIESSFYGIYLDHSNNTAINGNTITNNTYGINSQYSLANINFNRITGNSGYGILNQNNSTINATNNWWGSNNPPVVSSDGGSDIYNANGIVNCDSWLMLNVNVSTTNSGGNTSVTADLTHNNKGEDTSSNSHVPDSTPINFATTFGTIIGSVYTVKGKATTILNLGRTQNATVTATASLDNQTVSTTGTITNGLAILTIISGAIDNSTGLPLNITYTIPLNNSMTWISVLWNNTGTFSEELQIIVNGTVVMNKYFYDNAYNTWKNTYRGAVFNAISYVDSQSLTSTNSFDSQFWNNIASTYGLNAAELAFVQEHWPDFMDNLTFDLIYPGVAGQNITVVDPENSTDVVNLDFPGNVIHRTSQVTYTYHSSAGYEGVRSFAIATTKVDNDVLSYWLNQYSLYQPGAMKAAYGTFLNALIMEYTHDPVADIAANQYNVTWSRTSPIIVSAGDEGYQTYLTLECDHSRGMTVVGTLGNMRLFNYACSSVISSIEYEVMFHLGFNFQTNSVFNGTVGSVISDLSNLYLNGTALDEFEQDGFIITNAAGNDNEFIVIDPETGIVRDINVANGYCGAYCFSIGQTDYAINYGHYLTNNGNEIVVWSNVVVGTIHKSIEIDIDKNRAFKDIALEAGVVALALGCLDGTTEILAAGSGLSGFGVGSLTFGALDTTFSWLAGEYSEMFQDAWLTVKVNGQIVFKKYC